MKEKFNLLNYHSEKREALSVKFIHYLSLRYTLYAIRFSDGFTLIELLVAISVIVVVGALLLSVIVTTLRGTTKATVLADVKQNGDYAISQMARVLRSATSISINPACSSTPGSATSIQATQFDSTQTTFDCSGSTITSNGTSLLDQNAVKLTSCSISCSQQNVADYPVIQIQFSLQQQSNTALEEGSASVPFQTSVVLRNIQQ